MPQKREERVQRHAGDDPGQRDRQDEQERDRLAAEEAEAVDRERGQPCPSTSAIAVASSAAFSESQSACRIVLVVPGDRGTTCVVKLGDRPALDVRRVERVDA